MSVVATQTLYDWLLFLHLLSPRRVPPSAATMARHFGSCAGGWPATS